MSRIWAITLLLLCTTSLFGQRKKIAADKIKSVVVYEEKYEKGNGKAIKDSETSYDAHGNTIEEVEYKNGEVDKHLKYQYDDNHNKIKEIELDKAGKVLKTTEYKYDANNNKIKEIELDPSNKIVKTSEYIYDKGRKVEKRVYNNVGKLKSKKTYQYQTY